mgnify:CR=1 FL=1
MPNVLMPASSTTVRVYTVSTVPCVGRYAHTIRISVCLFTTPTYMTPAYTPPPSTPHLLRLPPPPTPPPCPAPFES